MSKNRWGGTRLFLLLPSSVVIPVCHLASLSDPKFSADSLNVRPSPQNLLFTKCPQDVLSPDTKCLEKVEIRFWTRSRAGWDGWAWRLPRGKGAEQKSPPTMPGPQPWALNEVSTCSAWGQRSQVSWVANSSQRTGGRGDLDLLPLSAAKPHFCCHTNSCDKLYTTYI